MATVETKSEDVDDKVYDKCVSQLKSFISYWCDYDFDENNAKVSKYVNEYIGILFYWFAAEPVTKLNKRVDKNKVATFSNVNDVWINKWFAKDKLQIEVDKHIKSEYEDLINSASSNSLNHWMSGDDIFGRLSLIILLDQMTRNCFRNHKKSYQFDNIALKLCLDGIEMGLDKQLPIWFRFQHYLPLVHAENIELQNKSVALYEKLKEIADIDKGLVHLKEIGNRFLKIAKIHQKHIEIFKRFPERNKILDRKSTDKEISYLQNTQQNTAY